MMSPQDLGMMGEQFVAGIMVTKGIPVRAGGPADLVIHGDTPVEIKMARLRPYKAGRQPGYQFCVEREGRSGLAAPILILICWREGDTPVFFVIPESQVNGVKRITITSEDPFSYSGKWAAWRNRWDLLSTNEEKEGRE